MLVTPTSYLKGSMGEMRHHNGVLCKIKHNITGSFLLKQRGRRRRLQQRLLTTEFTMFQNSSLKIHVFQFVKCWRIFSGPEF